jgi:2-oxoglutarate ferredoxin oxidoreductase subunit gamma
VLAFNEPSVDKFLPELLPGGLLMVNSSMMTKVPERSDVRILAVPATETAKNLGNPKVANMVMLGAYIGSTGAVHAESILSSLAEHGMRAELVQANREALEAGRGLVSHGPAAC